MDMEAGYNSLFCLVWKDEKIGVFVSHCLNYDLMECGPTADVAWDNLKFVMKNHVEYCYTSYQQGLKRKAGKKDWDRFFHLLERNPGSLTVDKIELELKPPSLPEQELEFWIQRVQSAGESADLQASEMSAGVN